MAQQKRFLTRYGRVPVLSLLALALLVLASCAPAAPASKETTGTPIKIGYLGIVTGPIASAGHAQKLAVDLAVQDINAAGGINGRPLQVQTEDAAADPKQAVTLMRKLAEQDKVFGILGPFTTGEFEVAAPLAVQLQVPIVNTNSVKPGIAAGYQPWAFRMTLTDDVSIPGALEFVLKKYPQVKKALIVGDTKLSSSENTIRNVYPGLLKAKGLEIIGTVDFETSTTDFSAIVSKIKEAKPDLIAYSSLGPNAFGVAKEMKRQGVTTPVLTSLQVIGSGAVPEQVNWYTASYFDENISEPKAKDLVARLKTAAEADSTIPKPYVFTNEPITYDAAMVLANGLRKGNITPDSPLDKARAAVRDAYKNLKDYRGIVSTYTMRPDGDAIVAPVIMTVDTSKPAWITAK